MSDEEADVYDVGDVSIIQYGGSLYITEGGSLYPIGGQQYTVQSGDGIKSFWRKLSPIARVAKPVLNNLLKRGKQNVKDLGKLASDEIVSREARILQGVQDTMDNFQKPASGSGLQSSIRDSLTPAQRKAFDKAMRTQKN